MMIIIIQVILLIIMMIKREGKKDIERRYCAIKRIRKKMGPQSLL